MASLIDSSTILKSGQLYRDRFFKDSLSLSRSNFKSDSDDSKRSNDNSNNDNDKPLPPSQITLSLGMPVLGKGFTLRE